MTCFVEVNQQTCHVTCYTRVNLHKLLFVVHAVLPFAVTFVPCCRFHFLSFLWNSLLSQENFSFFCKCKAHKRTSQQQWSVRLLLLLELREWCSNVCHIVIEWLYFELAETKYCLYWLLTLPLLLYENCVQPHITCPLFTPCCAPFFPFKYSITFEWYSFVK